MNLKSLSAQGRKLVRAINETDAAEIYELVDADEDGDTITLTFSKVAGVDQSDEEEDEDD